MADTTTRTTWEPTPNRKRITRTECKFLADNGFLSGRYELIDGEIIDKMGQNRPHALTIILINAWLIGVFGVLAVQCQSPIDVAGEDNETNKPEPDLAVLAQPATAYRENNPGPADVLLVVEVSDTALRFDLNNKALLYARAGIVEYWVADVGGRRFIVHRHPGREGYGAITEYGAEAAIATLARPNVNIRIAELFLPMLS